MKTIALYPKMHFKDVVNDTSRMAGPPGRGKLGKKKGKGKGNGRPKKSNAIVIEAQEEDFNVLIQSSVTPMTSREGIIETIDPILQMLAHFSSLDQIQSSFQADHGSDYTWYTAFALAARAPIPPGSVDASTVPPVNGPNDHLYTPGAHSHDEHIFHPTVCTSGNTDVMNSCPDQAAMNGRHGMVGSLPAGTVYTGHQDRHVSSALGHGKVATEAHHLHTIQHQLVLPDEGLVQWFRAGETTMRADTLFGQSLDPDKVQMHQHMFSSPTMPPQSSAINSLTGTVTHKTALVDGFHFPLHPMPEPFISTPPGPLNKATPGEPANQPFLPQTIHQDAKCATP